MHTIHMGDYQKIVVLTGAGISVASGLQPYRGPGGLWNDPEKVKYSSVEMWHSEPLGVWNAFAPFRASINAAEPNPAHLALARVEAERGHEQQFHLITQNIDGLHLTAGSQNVIELHGNVTRTRCSNDGCSSEPFPDDQTSFERLPICKVCGDVLRPHIVLFGEMIPADADHGARRALRDCDLFIAIGTSGTVSPASNFVRAANYEGARTILVNLEAMDPPNSYFDDEVLGRAEEVLPALLGVG